MRRMFNQLRMSPVQAWHERFRVTGGDAPWSTSRSLVCLGREFHDDLSFWRLILDRVMGPGWAITLRSVFKR